MTDLFATFASITMPDMARDSIVSAVTLEDLDFESDLPCEGPNHPNGTYGHIPTEVAGWLVSAPCGESSALCDGWVADCHLDLTRFVDCSCGKPHRLADLTYWRITDE